MPVCSRTKRGIFRSRCSTSLVTCSTGHRWLYRLTGWPSWLIRNFSKFQPISDLNTGLQFTVEQLFARVRSSSPANGCFSLRFSKTGFAFAPFTSHLANSLNMGMKRPPGRTCSRTSGISELSKGSLCPNWLQGNANTLRPFFS